jgi:hypothetical protein
MTKNISRKGERKMNAQNLVFEITEMVSAAAELEKYNHLGAVAAITENLYFAQHNE